MSKSNPNHKELTLTEHDCLLTTLHERFQKHPHCHPHLEWTIVQAKLEASPALLWTLNQMEQTGGEPDVVLLDASSDHYVFCDCSTESPSGRRSLCYDRAAHEARKEHKPANTAMDVAEEMGIELLTEEQYQALQQLQPVDTKTSSWIKTPTAIRKLGGAIFGDRRYNHVFIYHNGADSYYAARGFRGWVRM